MSNIHHLGGADSTACKPFFVDWLNCWQQFPEGSYPDFLGGRVVSINAFNGQCSFTSCSVLDEDTGEVTESWALSGGEDLDYNVPKFASHRGSFETNLMIRFVNGRLEVRGNPSAYGRLDNVFGIGLDESIEIYNQVLESLGLPCFTVGEETKTWLQREQKFVTDYTGVRITRVDLTCNYAVGMGNVRNYHKWLARQKLYRSATSDDDLQKLVQREYSTVYLSTSAYWMNVKAYDKAQAIEDVALPEYKKRLKAAAREGRIPKNQIDLLYNEAENYLMQLAAWCAEIGLTRLEYSLKNRWFAQRDGLGNWEPGTTESDLLDFVEEEAQKISDRAMVHQVEDFSSLTPAEYGTLDRWKKGFDIREYYSKSGFYKVRSSILKKTGYDIAARPVGLDKLTESRPVYFQVRPLSLASAPSFYQMPQVA